MPTPSKPIPLTTITTVHQAHVIVQDLLDATRKRGPLARLDRMRVLHVNLMAEFLDRAITDLYDHIPQLHTEKGAVLYGSDV